MTDQTKLDHTPQGPHSPWPCAASCVDCHELLSKCKCAEYAEDLAVSEILFGATFCSTDGEPDNDPWD
jgi:hypothetical protein